MSIIRRARYWCMKKTEEAFLAKPPIDTANIVEDIEKEQECKWFNPALDTVLREKLYKEHK